MIWKMHASSFFAAGCWRQGFSPAQMLGFHRRHCPSNLSSKKSKSFTIRATRECTWCNTNHWCAPMTLCASLMGTTPGAGMVRVSFSAHPQYTLHCRSHSYCTIRGSAEVFYHLFVMKWTCTDGRFIINQKKLSHIRIMIQYALPHHYFYDTGVMTGVIQATA